MSMSKIKNHHLAIVKCGKLKPLEILQASDVVRVFVRKHWRRDHKWCWNKLEISKGKFYKLLAISKWSKKVKKLVQENHNPLSQTSLFRIANRKWKDARQLFNKLVQLIRYLSHRKRNSLKNLKNKVTDKVSAYLKSRTNPLQNVYELTYMINGVKGAISSPDPKALNERMKNVRGYVYLGVRLVPG